MNGRGRDKLNIKETYTHLRDSAAEHFAQRTAANQAAFFLPHLRSGMNILDCGCGPGSITVGLAEVVAPGQTVGIDINERQIAQAQTVASNQGILNVRFETGSVYDLPFSDGSLDAVFCSAVLSHLRDPLTALTEIYRVLRSGGVVGIRNPDTDGQVVAPNDPILTRSLELYASIIAANGGNAKIGKHQRALLRQAGFVQVETSAVYEVYSSDTAVQYWGQLFAQGFGEKEAIEQSSQLGLADADAVLDMSKAWAQWAHNVDAFFADAWFEAVGWKP